MQEKCFCANPVTSDLPAVEPEPEDPHKEAKRNYRSHSWQTHSVSETIIESVQHNVKLEAVLCVDQRGVSLRLKVLGDLATRYTSILHTKSSFIFCYFSNR